MHRAYCFSFAGSLLCGGVSSACITSSSGDIPKSLPSGQSMITSRIPGQWGFPIPVRCVISATHLLHISSVAWCVEGTLSLNFQPRTRSQGAKRSCASELATSEAAQSPSYAANIFFSVEYSRPQILCILDSKTPGVDLESPLVLSARDSR